MQTFLPYADFAKSASVLDRQRLGKQRVEALQIMRTLANLSSGWQNHPAVKMWRGHEWALVKYGRVVCAEWISRGYLDTCDEKIVALATNCFNTTDSPAWLGDEAFHAAHRSNLLRKDRVWYGKFGWTEPDTMPYVWPVA